LVSPARLQPEALSRLIEATQGAVAAVGLVEGPVHVECKVGSEDVWFLELAARTIGGLCSRVLNCGGMSLEELVIRQALGLPTPTPTPGAAATGVLMLPVDETGRLEAVEGVEAARMVKGVTGVVISVGAGERVSALPAGDRYLGFVFARARTADQVEDALRAAWASIKIEITAS
jgi:biotin carboxylase